MEVQLRDYRIRNGQMDVWIAGDGFEAADERYYASTKRAALRPEPSELIEDARKVMVDTVL